MKLLLAIFLFLVSISIHSGASVTPLEDFANHLKKTLKLKEHGWISSWNFPKNVTVDVLKGLVGKNSLLRTKDTTGVLNHKFVTVKDIQMFFDTRDEWHTCESIIGVIKDQGSCDSSWAIVPASVISDRTCISSRGDKVVQLSAEDVLRCCKNCTKNTNVCDGGSTSEAWEFWMNEGVVSGGDYNSKEGCVPYSRSSYNGHSTNVCQRICTNRDYGSTYNEDKRLGFLHYRLPNSEKQIQMEMMSHGPVAAVMTVYKDFFFYKEGVYKHFTGEEVGALVVKIIGWGEEENGKYWLVANSWGNEWGNLEGFFKIRRGADHCGIESDVRAGRNSPDLTPREFIMKPVHASSESRFSECEQLLLNCVLLIFLNTVLIAN
ncbi:cathepsin B-like [Tenebrio molitor]|uniref:cathepsin B-like n=1 Tax=Tenebrio molitor TaxID=7067 RepID=UPI001C39AFB9|nr:unnamed protein product [Tenebrio molitor]